MLKSTMQLLIVVDGLILALATVVGLTFLFLAGAHPLMMSAPLGIAVFTGVVLVLSVKRQAKNLMQAVGLAATPLIFTSIWYGLVYKIVESSCRGWSCF
jgi:hypothetical protein